MKRLVSLAAALALTLAHTGALPRALAQDNTSQMCVDEMYNSLRKEQQFFRSIYLGQKAANRLPRGAVRFDGSNNPWIKTADNQWKTYAEAFATTTRTDSEMDTQAYPPKRAGLLETKRASTSELIPPLMHAMRAFQCRLRFVCEVALQSRSAEVGDTFDVKIDGCIEYTNARRINACKDYDESSGTTFDATSLNVQVGVCEQAADMMLKQEQAMLHTVIAYDASYRSFLGFAGIVQGFSDGLRGPVLTVLTDTVRTLQKFGDVPCFGSQCDE